jgi:hypothetical protein
VAVTGGGTQSRGLPTGRESRKRIVAEVTVACHLIYYCQLLLVDYLFIEAAAGGFVVFC